MLEVFNFLASYSFYSGGTVGNIFAHWQSLGVFSYVLPFLLIFALIFVVLENIPLFRNNKGVNIVIALAVGLMSLQFDFVSRFFSEIFPRFGIALSIVLVFVIMGGLFFDSDSKVFKGFFMILGLVVASVVVLKSISYFGWYTGTNYWWANNWGNVIGVLLFIALFIWIVAGKPSRKLEMDDLGTPNVFKVTPEKGK